MVTKNFLKLFLIGILFAYSGVKAQVSFPINESFENGLPSGWTAINENGVPIPTENITTNSWNRDGDNSLSITSSGNTIYLISPLLPSGTSSIYIKFKLYNPTESSFNRVYGMMSNPTDPSTFSFDASNSSLSADDEVSFKSSLNRNQSIYSGKNYFAIRIVQTGSNPTAYFDDLGLALISPSENNPYVTSSTSARIDFGSVSTSYTYDLEYALVDGGNYSDNETEHPTLQYPELTGLTIGQEYKVRVRKTETSSGNTSYWTTATFTSVECEGTPTLLQEQEINATTANLEWNDLFDGGITSSQGYLVQYVKGTTFEDDPSTSFFISEIKIATDSSITLSNLEEGELYSVRIKKICSGAALIYWDDVIGDNVPNLQLMNFGEQWSETIQFSTKYCGIRLKAADNFTWTENFDNAETGKILPDCFYSINDTPNISTNNAYSGNSMRLARAVPDYYNTFLVLPQIKENINLLKFSFQAKMEAMGDGAINTPLIIGVMTDPNDETTFEEVETLNLETDYALQTIDFAISGQSGYNKYIAIKNTNGFNEETMSMIYVFIDNLKIEYNNSVNCFTGNIGSWGNDENWSKGSIPTSADNVIIPEGKNIVVDVEPNYASLLLKDEPNVGKAEIINSSSSSLTNVSVEQYFAGYGADSTTTAGWYLIGVPIDFSITTSTALGGVFNPQNGQDDLFYWDSNDEEWKNWLVAANQATFFDSKITGYLVSYKKDNYIVFNGELNENSNYNMYYSNIEGKWFLFANPYPQTIPNYYIIRNGFTYPQTLNSNTGNYSDPTLEDVNNILPYQGFFSQAQNLSSSLTIIKGAGPAKSIAENGNKLILNLRSQTYSNLYDKAGILIRDNSTLGFDWQADNRKLEGLGNSPEIALSMEGEHYLVNAIPQIENSINIDLNFNSKIADNYILSVDNQLKDSYSEISLYDKQSGNLLNNFLENNEYNFYSNIEQSDKFFLKLTKNPLNLNNIKNSEETITLKQDKDIVKVITKTKLLSLELFNTKGQRVNYVEGNEVRLPSKGVFLLTITTEKGKTQKKVINL